MSTPDPMASLSAFYRNALSPQVGGMPQPVARALVEDASPVRMGLGGLLAALLRHGPARRLATAPSDNAEDHKNEFLRNLAYATRPVDVLPTGRRRDQDPLAPYDPADLEDMLRRR